MYRDLKLLQSLSNNIIFFLTFTDFVRKPRTSRQLSTKLFAKPRQQVTYVDIRYFPRNCKSECTQYPSSPDIVLKEIDPKDPLQKGRYQIICHLSVKFSLLITLGAGGFEFWILAFVITLETASLLPSHTWYLHMPFVPIQFSRKLCQTIK